jgi:hypothetical protein
MPNKTLSSSNHYLQKASASARILANVASSTAIETGKPSSTYTKRDARSGRFLEVKEPAPPKK